MARIKGLFITHKCPTTQQNASTWVSWSNCRLEVQETNLNEFVAVLIIELICPRCGQIHLLEFTQ